MTAKPTNGNGKVIWVALVGGLLTIALGGGAKLVENGERIAVLEDGKRVAVIEIHVGYIKEHIAEIDQSLAIIRAWVLSHPVE